MKKFLFLLSMFLLILCAAGISSAGSFEYSDYNCNPTLLESGESLKWTFNINDSGFDSSTDIIDSVNISLFLSDDYYNIIDGLDIKSLFNWSTGNLEYASLAAGGETYKLGEIDLGSYSVDLSAYLQLQSSGLLDVTLISTKGDFWYIASELTASGETAFPVPEPATMLLFGSGLVGLGFFGRRKFLNR